MSTTMPLMNHLAELRKSVVKALYGLAAGVLVSYAFIDHVMEWLRGPMLSAMPSDAKFVVLSPQEYFFTELKAALLFGAILSSPWLFYQVWNFISPGLYKGEKKAILFFVVLSSLCFATGVCFAYFLVFPPTFKFFIETLPQGVEGSYSIGMLYGFAITVLLAFGTIFQTPIAVYFLAILQLVSVESLQKYRPLVFVGAFIVGAILTPPDPITQIMLALPAYSLFELGLLCAKMRLKNKEKCEEVLD